MIKSIIDEAVKEFRQDFGEQENYETLERIYIEGMIKAFTAVFDMQLQKFVSSVRERVPCYLNNRLI